MLIEGEAGIGKTRLLHEFLASPSARRLPALAATCLPFREPFTLGPIVDALQQASPDPASLRLTALAGALRPLFPEWAADLPPAPEPLDDPGAARHRLFRAVAELLDALRVSVLVVDDAHWADDATLELLLFLVSRRSQPVSLVVAYRPHDVPADSLLLRLSAHSPAKAALVRAALSPLTLQATTDLVSSMLHGQPISEEFAVFLHERTDGIPLMLEESVRLLYDREDLIYRDRAWERHSLSELQVPATVRDSVLERARHLSPAAQVVLTAAAVLGEPAKTQTVAAVADVALAQVKAGLTEAARSGLLTAGSHGQIRFTHALAAQALYEDIPPLELGELHLRAGLALENAAHPPAIQLARHFREAGEIAKWCQHGEQAAAIAAVTGDSTTAITVLHELLTRTEHTSAVRVRLTIRLADITLSRRSASTGMLEQVTQVLREVLGSPDLDRRQQADVRAWLGRLLVHQGDYAEGVAELERAAPDLVHDPAAAAHVMSLLGWPDAGPWPARVHLTWLERAAALPAGSMSPADRMTLLVNRVTALLMLGEPAGWELAAEFPVEAETIEERMQLVRGHANIGYAAIMWGRYTEATRRRDIALDLAGQDNFERLRGDLSVAQAHQDWLTGAWNGLPDRVAALVDGETKPKDQLRAMLLAGLLAAAEGRDQAVAKALRQVLTIASRKGPLDLFAWASAALARLLLATGQADEALEITGDAAAAVLAKGVWILGAEIFPVRVSTLTAAHRNQDAEALVRAFAQGLGGLAAPAPQAALLLCRAIAASGQPDPLRAATLFADAATAFENLPSPYEAWLARERQATCLLAAGQAEPALALLSSAFPALAEIGARRDAERISARLRAEGGPRPRPEASGRRGYGNRLSPRELEVVQLVAAGWSNKKIAGALSRSPRTVEGQLRSAMRKLGVSTRTELAIVTVGREA